MGRLECWVSTLEVELESVGCCWGGSRGSGGVYGLCISFFRWCKVLDRRAACDDLFSSLLLFVFFVSLVCIVVKVYLHCPISYYVVTSLPFCVYSFSGYCIPILDRYLLFVVVL